MAAFFVWYCAFNAITCSGALGVIGKVIVRRH